MSCVLLLYDRVAVHFFLKPCKIEPAKIGFIDGLPANLLSKEVI